MILRLPPGLPLCSLPLPALLLAAVIAAVRHAELVAHQVGEPFGTLVLAVAVAETVIAVALIVPLMSAGGAGATAFAVFLFLAVVP